LDSKSILILDDEGDIVFTFRRSLEISGYAVFGFTDPSLALEHFNNNTGRYALVLSDIRMPKMDGLEFASNVRKLNRRVKILLMSAFDMKDLVIEPSLGIAGLLQKPLSPLELREIIAKHVDPYSSASRQSPD
jgi:CheY-like chemotaxis protein